MTESTHEYAPAPESRDAAGLRARYGLFSGGAFVEGGGAPRTTSDPATGAALAEVAIADVSDVDTAVRSARTALDGTWGSTTGSGRAKHLFRLSRLVQERCRELAVLETLDTGVPVRRTRESGVPAAAAALFHHAGWADKLDHAGFGPRPRPLGVAAGILPWHFPLLALARTAAPALACGNTVVLQPAPSAALSALVFAELCEQAGLPPGAVHVLPGDSDVTDALAARAETATFNGTIEEGKRLRRALAGPSTRLTLELDGNSPVVVFDDAPLDQAVDGIVHGLITGEQSRLLVQEPIADELTDRLLARLARLRVGDPLDTNTEVGAVHTERQLAASEELSASAEADGATRHTAPCPLPEQGLFCSPTVFTGVRPSMRIAREAPGGPLLPVLTFRTPDEAVNRANNTRHGRCAGVWTDKGSRALWMAQRLRAGAVWANTSARFDPTAASGGYQESGSGRTGGRAGLEAFLRV